MAATPPPDEAQCTMRGADGRPCPMHRKGHSAHADHTGASTGTPLSPDTAPAAPVCSLRAICNGPMAGLAVLLVQPGVLPHRTALPVDLLVDDAPPESPARLIHGLFSPDLPPPRA